MNEIPEEERGQRFLTTAIGLAALICGGAAIQAARRLIGNSSIPPEASLGWLALSLGGLIGAFAVLGSKRWGIWLAIISGAGLQILCFASTRGLVVPWSVLALILLVIAVRPQWRYMD